MSVHVGPGREDLEVAIGECWLHPTCKIEVGDRFETDPADGYASPVGGRAILVYDLNVCAPTTLTVLNKPSSWLWFDNAIVEACQCRVAYLYLLEIKPDWRNCGVGSAYIDAKTTVLPNFGVSVVYLDAGHQGPRFWSRHGFQFVNEARFWADYAEYCYFNDLPTCEDIDQVADEFFQHLRDSCLTYPMYRRI